MAYDKNKFELLAGAGVVITLWGYKSATDNKADIDTTGYFNGASSMLQVGDWIIINAADGYGISVVLSNSGGVVDVADLTAFGGTDTD
jgi:hypothetical protein